MLYFSNTGDGAKNMPRKSMDSTTAQRSNLTFLRPHGSALLPQVGGWKGTADTHNLIEQTHKTFKAAKKAESMK